MTARAWELLHMGCLLVIPMSCVAFACWCAFLVRVREYAPPPLGEVRKAKPLSGDQWEFVVLWNGRKRRVEGRDQDWIFSRRRRPVRSRLMRGWLRVQWAACEGLRDAMPQNTTHADELLESLEAKVVPADEWAVIRAGELG